MNWNEILADYEYRMMREKQLGINIIRERFGVALENMSSSDFENFEDGELPSSLTDIIMVDPKTGNFVSKEYPDIVIGTIYDVFLCNKILSHSEIVANREYASAVWPLGT